MYLIYLSCTYIYYNITSEVHKMVQDLGLHRVTAAIKKKVAKMAAQTAM